MVRYRECGGLHDQVGEGQACAVLVLELCRDLRPQIHCFGHVYFDSQGHMRSGLSALCDIIRHHFPHAGEGDDLAFERRESRSGSDRLKHVIANYLPVRPGAHYLAKVNSALVGDSGGKRRCPGLCGFGHLGDIRAHVFLDDAAVGSGASARKCFQWYVDLTRKPPCPRRNG